MFHTTPASFLTAVSAVSAMSMKLNSAFVHLFIAAVNPRSPSLMDERLVSAVEHGVKSYAPTDSYSLRFNPQSVVQT
jgi:hypothetical protein